MTEPERLTLDRARDLVGFSVTYQPPLPGVRAEHGVISSVGQTYVFVLYEGDTAPKATRPGDLVFS